MQGECVEPVIFDTLQMNLGNKFFTIRTWVRGEPLPGFVSGDATAAWIDGASVAAYHGEEIEPRMFARIEIADRHSVDGIAAALTIWSNPEFDVSENLWTEMRDAIDAYAAGRRASVIVMHASEASTKGRMFTTGFSPTHEYAHYELNVASLRERVRQANERLSQRSAISEVHFSMHDLANVDHRRVIEIIAAHDLVSGAEMRQFERQRSLNPPYDLHCSTVVLAEQEIAGVLLTRIQGEWADESLRAVAPAFMRWSGRINALMLHRTLDGLVARGVSRIRLVLNARQAIETGNLAERCDGRRIDVTTRYERGL